MQFLSGTKISKAYLIVGIIVVASPSLFSQSFNNPEHGDENYMPFKQGWFIGVDAGTTLFYGDISLYNNFPKMKDFRKSSGRGFAISGGKKFKFGLSAEAQLFKGTLKGEKLSGKLYPRYFNADITGYSVDAKFNLTHALFRQKNDRKFFNRLTVYATVGFGQVYFRSRLYKYASNNQWYLENVSGFTSASIDTVSTTSGGGLVTSKAKIVSALILPVGGKISFKLNAKTDLIFNANYVTVFSDEVDAWTRGWTHKDRYLYTGLGFIYNFNGTSDVPDSDRLFRPGSGSKRKRSGAKSGDAYDKSGSSDNGAIKGFFNKKEKKEDKDLEIRMKLYELQLKLFEMQYLMK